MMVSKLFKRAMKAIGDKASRYEIEKPSDVTEYLTGLSLRTTSDRRALLLIDLALAIRSGDVDKTDSICKSLNSPVAKTSMISNSIKLKFDR